MALALNDSGRSEEAIAAYRRAIQLKPDYVAAHNNLGDLLRAQGRTDEAAAEFRQALVLNPDQWEALNNLGNALKDQRSVCGIRGRLSARHPIATERRQLADAQL